jgi:hypothetical protein
VRRANHLAIRQSPTKSIFSYPNRPCLSTDGCQRMLQSLALQVFVWVKCAFFPLPPPLRERVGVRGSREPKRNPLKSRAVRLLSVEPMVLFHPHPRPLPPREGEGIKGAPTQCPEEPSLSCSSVHTHAVLTGK